MTFVPKPKPNTSHYEAIALTGFKRNYKKTIIKHIQK